MLLFFVHNNGDSKALFDWLRWEGDDDWLTFKLARRANAQMTHLQTEENVLFMSLRKHNSHTKHIMLDLFNVSSNFAMFKTNSGQESSKTICSL